MARFRGIRYAAGCVISALLLIAFPTVSLAYSGPPKAILHSGTEKQAGHGPYFYKGRPAPGNQCSVMHGDGFYDWPPALHHDDDRKLRLRFHKDSKPDKLKILDYPRIGDHDAPAGHSRKVSYELKRVRNEDGETIGWKALFNRRGPGHHYLDVYAKWQGQGCRFDEAAYNFHVKTAE